jgi:hypothetical protein
VATVVAESPSISVPDNESTASGSPMHSTGAASHSARDEYSTLSMMLSVTWAKKYSAFDPSDSIACFAVSSTSMISSALGSSSSLQAAIAATAMSVPAAAMPSQSRRIIDP